MHPRNLQRCFAKALCKGGDFFCPRVMSPRSEKGKREAVFRSKTWRYLLQTHKTTYEQVRSTQRHNPNTGTSPGRTAASNVNAIEPSNTKPSIRTCSQGIS